MDNLRRLRVRCHDGKVIATSFPGELEISFNRTLRLPEDGKTHNQPVRLGTVTVNSMAGLAKKLEASGSPSLVDMARKGGVFFPLYQREAMFLSFKARRDAFAVRVFVGGVNAVSGLPWNSHPGRKVAAQDYLSVPPQRYLDGVCVAKDVVKQFVAMPLGSGYSVEKQVTGKETVGGMQLEIIPGYRWALHVPASEHAGPQPGPYFPGLEQTPQSLGVKMVALSQHPNAVSSGQEKYGTDSEDWLVASGRRPIYMRHLYRSALDISITNPSSLSSQAGWAMGLAAGAKMHQAIQADPFPASAWCTRRATVVSVQILNSVAYEALTGMLAPATPITAEMYVARGLPFLASYDEKGVGTDGAANLAGIRGVGDIDGEAGPVSLGASATGGGKVGCTCCGKMLCDSM
ncbi:hypothetical protein B0T25DRAFT_462237 [Lasiosphaeria hispida]|uniref:Uncharacterized protein n=1 Tax=Lasiosphaeria hispida TaxID=260671 RepID=A0AAJ0MB42_9PEZI|nr:hypothetical protein B0T25DRAFT_462237 [Lasiosphaeria hispida]